MTPQQKWKLKNPERVLAQKARWHLRMTMRRFGLTPEDYERIRAEQGGKCAICEERCDRLHVDHCHETNKFRGLLCNNCNRALGFAGDDADVLRRAAEYLEKHQ